MNDLQKAVIHTLSYFSFFNYAPTTDEVYTFFPIKITRKKLQKELARLIQQNVVKFIDCHRHPGLDPGSIQCFHKNVHFNTIRWISRFAGLKPDLRSARYSTVPGSASSGMTSTNSQRPTTTGLYSARYTLGEYSMSVKNMESKVRNSIEKIQKARSFIRVLSWFLQIKMIGLSGSVAMMNAKHRDDIDLFIITASGRMWTARIIGLFLAQIMGVRRRLKETEVENKICLNLFFDESDLKLPIHKHTEYGAHEVLQMKPVVDKDMTYLKFINANSWVFERFPNAKSVVIPMKIGISLIKTSANRRGSVGYGIPIFIGMTERLIEKFCKWFQLSRIRRHQTSEIITATQLWFFPADFEKKMKSAKS